MSADEDKNALELKKLEAEIALLKAQEDQIAHSIEDATKRGAKFWGRAPIVGGFVLAAAALGGFGASVWTEWRVYQEQVLASRTQAIAHLESENASERSAAVYALRTLAKDSEVCSEVIHALVIAFGSEGSALIRSAMIDVFADCSGAAIEELSALRKESNERAQRIADLWGASGQVLSEVHADNSASPELVAKSRETFRSNSKDLRDAQWAFVNASEALRVLTSPDEKLAPINLSGGWLRSFSFVSQSIDLRGAIFDGAGLMGADFFGVDLSGARFDGTELVVVDFGGAVLKNADFTRAEFYLPEPARFLSERERSICIGASGTDFSDAVLDGATFTEAILHGVNFKNSIGLTADQMRQANSYTGAIFSKSLTTALGHSNPKEIRTANIEKAIEAGRKLEKGDLSCTR